MIPIPKNLALLATQELNDREKAAIEKVFKSTDLRESLLTLGAVWKVKVWFNCEFEIQIARHTTKRKEGDVIHWIRNKGSVTSNAHVFNKITTGIYGGLLYGTSRRARHGYPFPSLDTVVRYEPVINGRLGEFSSFEDFKAKFDPLFITGTEIHSLWSQNSSQHGGQYKPSDFHRIGPEGLKVLERFLRFFRLNAAKGTPGYNPTCREEYTCMGRGNFGRDIKIEHSIGANYVRYASEYPGCGNGRYGLVANKREFLHTEDD